MNDLTRLRIENLKKLDKTPSDLTRDVGSTVSYWSDLMAGRKSFGEKTARKIEAAYDLPHAHLDRLSDRVDEFLPVDKTPDSLVALRRMYDAIHPDFRAAAFGAATIAMSQFLHRQSTDAHDQYARDTSKSEESPSSPIVHKIP